MGQVYSKGQKMGLLFCFDYRCNCMVICWKQIYKYMVYNTAFRKTAFLENVSQNFFTDTTKVVMIWSIMIKWHNLWKHTIWWCMLLICDKEKSIVLVSGEGKTIIKSNIWSYRCILQHALLENKFIKIMNSLKNHEDGTILWCHSAVIHSAPLGVISKRNSSILVFWSWALIWEYGFLWICRVC